MQRALRYVSLRSKGPDSRMTDPTSQNSSPGSQIRIGWLDAFRGIALLAMATYHLTWDFEYFGYLMPGTAGHGLPKLYARGIATTFLFLAGLGLVLAHRNGLRTRPYLIRLGKVAGAAAAITLVTWFAMPEGFIHFGILHQIALASIVGLAFIGLPPLVTLAVAAVVLVLPALYQSSAFDHPALWWVGLQEKPRLSFDYVPFFPWFAAVLAGIAAGNMQTFRNWLASLPEPARLFRPFALAGRHSLLVYLLHQIPLFGLVWLLSMVAPPDRAESYMQDCMQSCSASGGESLCRRFCQCTLDELQAGNMLEGVQTGKIPTEDSRIQDLAFQCSMKAQQQ